MEALSVLEKKIAALVELVQELREEKSKLVEQNAQLMARIEHAEDSLLTDNERLEKLNQERALTKTVVDDLIRSIDLLVENEKRQ
ncbi:MAG TPA: hypothetical protein VFF04_06715 [Candidatus Babeliales bacterium]|nr:hypothetical protein [Candidatus Babeliales bacterium]